MMNTIKIHILFASSLSILVALCTWTVATAYITCCKWASTSATYTYDPSLPSTFQSGISDSAFTWTNSSSSSWAWVNSPTPGSLIKYGALDSAGNVLAATTLTRVGPPTYPTITKIDMKLDSAENWYTGTGTPGSAQKDLRFIATHEFGHGLGLEHSQSANCPGGSSNATMCAGYTNGTTHLRSLQSDDNSGLQFLYP